MVHIFHDDDEILQDSDSHELYCRFLDPVCFEPVHDRVPSFVGNGGLEPASTLQEGKYSRKIVQEEVNWPRPIVSPEPGYDYGRQHCGGKGLSAFSRMFYHELRKVPDHRRESAEFHMTRQQLPLGAYDENDQAVQPHGTQ